MKIRGKLASPLLAAAALVCAGCSKITILRTEELHKVEAQVKEVKEQVVELRKSVDDLSISQGGTSSKMKADLTSLLGELQTQITRLHSDIDATQFRLGQLNAKIDKLDQKKIIVGGGMPGAPSAVPAVSGTPDAQPPAAAPTGETMRVVDGLDLENLYNQARDDYIRGKYDLAMQGFKSVYEKDSGGSWKEAALYWMGECLFKQNQLDQALASYQRYLQEFPRGGNMCAARFKLGLLYHQKGQTAQRNEEWRKLSSECPDSNEAQRAAALSKE